MVRLIRPKKTIQIAVVTESTRNNGDNLNNILYEASRQFRNKNREYLKAEIDTLASVGLEVKAEKTKYMLLSCHQNADQNWNLKWSF
jgi:hypothetical protein